MVVAPPFVGGGHHIGSSGRGGHDYRLQSPSACQEDTYLHDAHARTLPYSVHISCLVGMIVGLLPRATPAPEGVLRNYKTTIYRSLSLVLLQP